MVRYERRVTNYRGLCVFAAILFCLRILLIDAVQQLTTGAS